ncbi:hypothetical protein JRO89_XS08G0030400 [Xanthoceras sorbifolium]|uniref:Protein CPR-5-like n=1 Tax=Xanthoceras sorbifolium TaxID=99658 RepID=A0ABQ8HNG7_9ROSI|nr:hypothetical protein JRO89_XS08G0030400 [Xanthoceras sorbifolium]
MDAPLPTPPPPTTQPQLHQSTACVDTENPANPVAVDPNPTVDDPPPSSKPAIRYHDKRRKKSAVKDVPTSSSCSSSASSTQRGTRVALKRRSNPKIRLGPVRRNEGGDMEAIALPLGMSFAAVVAQVTFFFFLCFYVDGVFVFCLSFVALSVFLKFLLIDTELRAINSDMDMVYYSLLSSLINVNITARIKNVIGILIDLLLLISLEEKVMRMSSINFPGIGNSEDVVVGMWVILNIGTTSISRSERMENAFFSKMIVLLTFTSIAPWHCKVLERKDAAGDRMSIDHLSRICTSAVRESLTNVFGDKFDFFARNFEKSFGTTLRTLTLINESSTNEGGCHLSNLDASTLDVTSNENGCIGNSGINYCHSETNVATIATQDVLTIREEVQEKLPTNFINKELVLHGQNNQLVCASSSTSGSVTNQAMLSTMEKSVMEQVRSNDLKTVELGLVMKRLKLKETQLALNHDSNHLERSKLAMGKSKASFRAEKFKTQLEDTRHSELLKKCIDCLVAGLVIMSASLSYAAYVHSYKKITEATAACTPSQESKSWWIPNTVSSFHSGLHTLKCQVQVVSRMLFGMLMIITIAYLLLQRSGSSKQTMPITFILLLLGFACGFAGKLCIDTLGGSGYHWLLYWESLCLVHFFANVCTSALFRILHGPINMSQGTKDNTIVPYWIRRSLFYAIMLLFLPLVCGLLPFASLGEWIDHFTDYQSSTSDWDEL